MLERVMAVLVVVMNSDIREKVHNELPPCTNEVMEYEEKRMCYN